MHALVRASARSASERLAEAGLGGHQEVAPEFEPFFERGPISTVLGRRKRRPLRDRGRRVDPVLFKYISW